MNDTLADALQPGNPGGGASVFGPSEVHGRTACCYSQCRIVIVVVEGDDDTPPKRHGRSFQQTRRLRCMEAAFLRFGLRSKCCGAIFYSKEPVNRGYKDEVLNMH